MKWSRRHRSLVTATVVFLLLAVIGLAVSTVLIARERLTAVQQRDRAEAQTARVLEREATIRLQLYVADIGLARRAWEHGDLREMRRCLARHVPGRDQEDLRGFEWYYLVWLAQESDTLIATLPDHGGACFGVAFSPDGRTLATAGKDGKARLWDLASQRIKAVLPGHSGDVNGVAFSPDGKHLVSCGDDRKVKLWDVASGTAIANVGSYNHAVVCVAFSPDGKNIAAGSRDHFIRVYDTATRRELDCAHAFGEIEFFSFSPDGRRLCAANQGGGVIWHLGQQLRPLSEGRPYGACSIAYAPHGRLLATGHDAGVVRLWNMPAGTLEAEWRAHPAYVPTLTFSRDGATLFTNGGEAGVVRVWDVRTQILRTEFTAHAKAIWCLTCSPDGKVLASASEDGTVKLWRIQDGSDHKRLTCSEPPAHLLAFDPQGRQFVTTHGAEAKVLRWDVATDQVDILLAPLAGKGIDGVARSPNGTTIIVGAFDGTIQFWDTAQKSLRRMLRSAGRPEKASILDLSLSPDGRWLAVMHDKEPPTVWDLRTEPPVPHELDSPVRAAVAWSPDSTTLATASTLVAGAMRHWDFSAGRPRLLPFSAPHADRVLCLRFSPDGRTLSAAVGLDGVIHLWSVPSGREMAPLRGYHGIVTGLAFSPDGRTLAAQSFNVVKLWHVAAAQELCTLQGSGANSGGLAFSPDGTILANSGGSADGKGEVFLWLAPRQGLGTPAAR